MNFILEINLVHPESLTFWSVIIFGVLIFLLAKYAWKPILSTVKEREDSINKALDAAEEAKRQMANLKADNDRLLAEAKVERDNLLKEARELKDQIVAQAKEEAQKQSDKMIIQAREIIENEKKMAITDLKNQVVTLSLEIAEKVIKKELSSSKEQDELIGKMLKNTTLN